MDASLRGEVKPSRRHMNRAIFEKEIVACDEALGELEKAVVDMKYKRIALDAKLNSTSPFLAILPLDVISEIFYLVNESQDREDFCQLPPPFLLGRICQAWREIALSRPRLWSIIVIRLSHGPMKLHAQQELRQWLKNSSTHTLHYYIKYKEALMPESVAELILETSSRWRSFNCDSLLSQLLHMDSNAGEEEDGISHSFPHLNRICLDLNIDIRNKTYSFGSTPQLRCLQVHRPTRDLVKFHVNWGQLSTLTASVDVCSALDVLMSLNSIQHLSFENTIPLNSELSLSQFQTLPHLLSLKIIGNKNFIRSILSRISTPALQKLSLCNQKQKYEPEQSWGNAILDLHNRAPFPLKFLKLENLVMSEAVLVALLQRFTFLSSFSLDGYSDQISDRMIRQLDPTEASNPSLSVFLPALRKFTYSQGKIAFGAKTMIKMLEQRVLWSQNVGENKVKALRSIDIKYTNINWSKEGDRANPNDLQAFYRDVTDLATRGSTLKLVWVKDTR